MAWVAVGIAGAQLIGGAITSGKAKKERKKAEAEQRVNTDLQKKEIDKATAIQQRAEMDLGNEFAGQANIDPEAQYALNQTERGTAGAIDKAMRTGSNATEIMNLVSGLTGKGQQGVRKITAERAGRRKALMTASKGQAVKAAATGLAGTQAKLNVENQGYSKTMQQQQLVNQAAGQNFNFVQGALGDLGSAYMMNKLYGGGGTKTPKDSKFKTWVDNSLLPDNLD